MKSTDRLLVDMRPGKRTPVNIGAPILGTINRNGQPFREVIPFANHNVGKLFYDDLNTPRSHVSYY